MMASKDTGAGLDVIVIGGGHNGLVAAGYLAKAGLKVAVLEARDILGGPCGAIEFLPGFRSSITNSPGSFEPRILRDLDLEGHGLRFHRTDPNVVHVFPEGCFIGWRDREAVAAQLDAFAPGEAARYNSLLSRLEELGRHLGVSVFEPSRSLAEMARNIPLAQERLFEQVFFGSLRELLDENLHSEQAKALLGMVALNATLAPPSAPGTAIGLMMRPISLASSPALDANDPRRTALRGSTGLPIGGMGAIIDALESVLRAHGAEIHTNARVASVLHSNGRATGVVTATGCEFHAKQIISAVNPRLLFGDMLDDAAVGAEMRREVAAVPMRGSAFKMFLALDGLPSYRGLPDGVSSEQVAGTQFRIASSLAHIEDAVLDGMRGVPSEEPIMWGLMPTVSSPDLAPAGKHLMSVNVWHAPYDLRCGSWDTEKDVFGRRCIEVLSRLLTDLKDRIIGHHFLSPVDLERELGLVGSNITHGDMLPNNLFGARPHVAANNYRTPLHGLYLSASGTWPGGYVTGIPGHNTAAAVLADIANATTRQVKEAAWNS
ncbi:phytoene dehydrogenase-like protein [Aminobacter lissarensis]|uniref:Pyridine nucleotide-disulfide oxidoreductase domain-containing protein 2 n=1 Tax=Aminobacter carboxidus TaxID=376165 RepID=A0A8E2BEK6_9HYPH|nr:NAD(P)/FAD-dependent oxidoreductase [Aminobacter lissarensis]MBB6468444.1 phytoene dehydrogenase-like protein [Aminobacter lissarensis]